MKLFAIFAMLAVTALGATEPASPLADDKLALLEDKGDAYQGNSIRNPVNLFKRGRCDWCRAALPVCVISRFKSIKWCRQNGCDTDWKNCHQCKLYPCQD